MGWLDAIGDATLGFLVAYGYPALAGILFAGAVGVPVPSGAATSIVGSLVAQGTLNLAIVAAVATIASVLGDLVGYWIGQAIGCPMLNRYGKWVGLPYPRLVKAYAFFHRWGAPGVFLTRTVLSGLSPAVNLMAGASHYRRNTFVVWDAIGRAVWTAIYLGIGYWFERTTDPGIDVIEDQGGLLVVLLLACAGALVLYRHYRPHPHDPADSPA